MLAERPDADADRRLHRRLRRPALRHAADQQRFIDLWPLDELRGISVDRDVLRIGALTTYTEIIESELVQRRVPMLAAAAREVGGAQIQNRGTLGGNIANASPAGDTLPVLAAAGARIVLRSRRRRRARCRSTRSTPAIAPACASPTS